MTSVNPATGKPIRDYAEASPSDVTKSLAEAGSAFGEWSATPIQKRAEKMKAAAAVLRANAGRYAELITQEMGKPIAQSEAEVEKCAWGCEHYAQHAEEYLAPETIATDAAFSGVQYQPLGVILAVMPWNFPFWQVFRFAAPTLMAGNVAILKHASNVPGCSLAIQQVFQEAEFPRGAFSSLLIGNEQVAKVIAHASVKAVSLTGSEGAGRAIASEVGKHLKKTVLELGGSDPFIVLADADIEMTVDGAVVGRTQNTGQSCVAAKRFIIEAPAYDAFCEAFTRKMQGLVVGDPMGRETQVGPLAREDLVAALHMQVEQSISQGARLLCGGERLNRDGFFYAPTVLAEVQPGMPAFDEETFGPVATVTRAHNAEQAVELANTSGYGLGASIWTANTDVAHALAKRIESGSVFVNGIVKSDPRLPFGGIKNSGYGRELGRAGILEFVNTQSIWVR